jgi:mannose-6-phosphate isomerase-like protein (cupin superfamily)
MSSFRHPVGPEAPRVYWRRRAAVIGVLLLIVVVVVLIVVGRGSGATAEAGATASASATAGSASTDASSGAAGAESSARPSSAPAASSSPSAAAGSSGAGSAGAAGATCSKDQIQLTPVLDKSAYAATEDPKIAMSIKNTGSASCHMNLGSSQQVLTISSGAEQYWSSKDCQTGGTDQDVTIKAGQTLTTPAITWDRTRSSTSTCDSSRPAVTGGGASYHLQVAVGSLVSKESAQFILQ